MGHGLGVREDDGEEEPEMVPKEEFDELAGKYEELKERVEEYLDDEQAHQKRSVPIIKAPMQGWKPW